MEEKETHCMSDTWRRGWTIGPLLSFFPWLNFVYWWTKKSSLCLFFFQPFLFTMRTNNCLHISLSFFLGSGSCLTCSLNFKNSYLTKNFCDFLFLQCILSDLIKNPWGKCQSLIIYFENPKTISHKTDCLQWLFSSNFRLLSRLHQIAHRYKFILYSFFYTRSSPWAYSISLFLFLCFLFPFSCVFFLSHFLFFLPFLYSFSLFLLSLSLSAGVHLVCFSTWITAAAVAVLTQDLVCSRRFFGGSRRDPTRR